MSVIIAPLLFAVVAPEEVRPMSSAEMAGLRIWKDRPAGVVAGVITGSTAERWSLSFKNETNFEIGSITVREVFLSGKERIYESPPVTISKFSNMSVPYVGTLLSKNKTWDNKDVLFEVPSKYARMYTARTTEILRATTFRLPNLHNAGHLYAKLQFTSPVDMIVLLKKDPSLMKVKEPAGLTPTLMAFGSSDLAVIQYMVDHGGSVKDVTKGGSTIMHLAAINGRPEVLDYARRMGGNVSARTKAGRTPLEKAIVTGQRESWKWLLSHGAKPEDNGGVPAASPAMYAIVEGQEMALDDLARAGAKPQGLTGDGYGWMHFGVMNYMMLDPIRRHGVPVDQRGRDGVTPLMLAAGGGAIEASMWLLDHGAKADLQDKHGQSAFDYAKRAGNQTFPVIARRYGR
jgi:ankyrin repeat protein